LARPFAHPHADQTGGVVLVDAEGRDAWRRARAAWPTSVAPKLRRAIAERRLLKGVDLRASAALAQRRPRSL
jgi:hypothetical protein